MPKPRSRPIAVALALVPLAIAASVVLAGASHAGPKSTPLHGHMSDIANFGGPGCTSSTGVCSSFVATGVISGDGVVSVETLPTPIGVGAEGITKAHTVVHTRDGDLRCNEAALFDLGGTDHPFVDLCLISGGTGRYEGASGYIQEVGTFDFATNHGEVEYFGKIVYGDG